MEANGNGTSAGNGNGNGNGAAGNATQHKNVYTVVDTKGGKAVWVKIGAAFTNRDGSFTIRLDALPINGTMQVREPAAWEERRPELANTAGSGQRHASEAFA